MTILILGTFGIWAFHALKNKHLLDTEEHTESMAAISFLGINREGKEPLLQALDQSIATLNLEVKSDQDGGNDG